MPVIRPHPLALALFVSAAALATAQVGPARADDAVFGAPTLPPGADWFDKNAAPAPASAPGPASPTGAGWLPERTKPAEPAATADTAGPNLGALRFFAAQNDLARVAAEIRLLRAKYPGWEPPADLFTATPTGENEQPLWDLFGKHDLQGIKQAIADRQARTPGWQPSADLSGKLALALAGDDLVRASNAKDYGAVLDVAAAHRDLLTCGNVDAIWRSAEALAATGDQAHAADAYRYVLTNCTNAQERLATVQKASAVLTSPDAIDGLIRLGRHLPDGTDEFAELRFDGARRRIGEALKVKQPATPADLESLGGRARQTNGGKDAELLGWYALAQKDDAGAETWFRTALQGGSPPSPKAAEGLVLALRDGGKVAEAVTLAQQYASLAPANRKVMMEVLVANLETSPLTPDQTKTLASAIDAEQSADAAQAFGWHQFKAGAVADAASWFNKSLAWQPSEAAAVGKMVAAQRLKQPADVAATVAQYAATYPHVKELAEVMRTAERPHPKVRQASARSIRGTRPHSGGNTGGWDQGASDIVSTFQNGNVDQALAMMEARRATRAEPNGLSVVRGWALYKKGDWEGARQVFNEVGRRGMSDEAGKGLRQIDLGYTNPRYR